MSEVDFLSTWEVLVTESNAHPGVGSVVDSGFAVSAGPILLGVDAEGCRSLLVPLAPGEAFSPDPTGRSVHLRRVGIGSTQYASAVCLHADLLEVFARFAWDLASEIDASASAARALVEAFDRWRQLFADGFGGDLLSRNQVIGLIGELLVLEEIFDASPMCNVACWTGPDSTGGEHDFRRGVHALEVKSTLVREGRIVSISNVDQLESPASGTLHLIFFRFGVDPNGFSLPDLVARVRSMATNRIDLDLKLNAAGYRDHDAHEYSRIRVTIAETSIYDTLSAYFPKITRSSFKDGALPPGTLRLQYAIDLTNEPPSPLSAVARRQAIASLGRTP